MNTMKFLTNMCLLSILNVCVNVAAMPEDVNQKVAFERSKRQALWRMGGAAVGALAVGAVALLSVEKRCCRSIKGENSTQLLRVSQAAVIAGSGVAGALIGACACTVGSANDEYDKKKKKEIAQWRMGGALAGGTLFLTAAFFATRGMVGEFQESQSGSGNEYSDGYYREAYTPCAIYPSEAIKIIGASGVGAAASAVIAQGMGKSIDDLLDNDK